MVKVDDYVCLCGNPEPNEAGVMVWPRCSSAPECNKELQQQHKPEHELTT